MRPVFGSIATTVPFMLPRASTAAARTTGSSPPNLVAIAHVVGEGVAGEALIAAAVAMHAEAGVLHMSMLAGGMRGMNSLAWLLDAVLCCLLAIFF